MRRRSFYLTPQMNYHPHNRDLGLSNRWKALASEQGARRQQRRRKRPTAKATIDIATATSASGQVAYGAVIKTSAACTELSACTPTTPHRTVVLAAESSLRSLKQPHAITVSCASAYLVDSMEKGFVEYWAQHGWCKRDGGTVRSRDLWAKILRHCARHTVVFVAEAGPAMARAEALATQTADGADPAPAASMEGGAEM